MKTLDINQLRVYRDKVVGCARDGQEAWNRTDYAEAIRIFQAGLNLAESQEDRGMIAIMRRAIAAVLLDTRKMKQALATLTPLLQNRPGKEKGCCEFGAALDFVHIAQQIPVCLATIEQGYRYAEAYADQVGQEHWGSLLLGLKAELCMLRGQYPEAVAAAQESLARYRDACPRLYWAASFTNAITVTLVSACLHTQDDRTAKRYLRDWERRGYQSRYEEALFQALTSDRLRARGEMVQAVRSAQRAVDLLEVEQQRTLGGFEVMTSLIRALLAAGQWKQAAEALWRVRAMRRSESAHLRYTYHLLLADCHLTKARQFNDMPAMDLDDGKPFPGHNRAHHAADKGKAGVAFCHARRRYQIAMEIAREIDVLLHCDLRQHQVACRLQWIG